MSVNAAMIQMMVDKGLSGQDIADIIKAGEQKVDRTGAERQARYRAKKREGKRNAVTSRRYPPIEERNHTPGSEISPDGETQNDCAIRDADWPEFPDWLPAKPWNGFIAMRDGKRAHPTARAVELLIADLTRWRAKGHDPGVILDTSTACNWTGLFEPKDRKDGQPPKQRFASNSTLRELAERSIAGG